MSLIPPTEKLCTDHFDYITANYLKADTILAPADIGFVFGSYYVSDQLAEKAAELYKRGFFPKILVTGGEKRESDKSIESISIRDRLLELGIPEDDILLETKASNTQENIEFSKKIIAEQLGSDSVSTLISIGNIKSGRRFLMTLKKHWKNVFAMHASVNAFDRPADEWWLSNSFHQAVLEQYGKIGPYIKKGYIESVDIDAINNRATMMLKTTPQKLGIKI